MSRKKETEPELLSKIYAADGSILFEGALAEVEIAERNLRKKAVEFIRLWKTVAKKRNVVLKMLIPVCIMGTERFNAQQGDVDQPKIDSLGSMVQIVISKTNNSSFNIWLKMASPDGSEPVACLEDNKISSILESVTGFVNEELEKAGFIDLLPLQAISLPESYRKK